MFEKATGHDLWDWLKQEPERDSCFNLGMAETDKAGATPGSRLSIGTYEKPHSYFSLLTSATSFSKPSSCCPALVLHYSAYEVHKLHTKH